MDCCLSCGLAVAADKAAEPVAGKTSAWQTGQETQLTGVKIRLSQPVLVARRKGFLWFPTLTRLTNGKVTGDGVGPHADLLPDFPYLGAPHSA